MSKMDPDDALDTLTNPAPLPDGISQSNSSATPPNGADPSPSDPHPSHDPPHPHHHAHDPSDPQPSPLPSSHYRLSTQSTTSLISSRPAPPSPIVSRRESAFSRTSSRRMSTMSSSAPSRPLSGVQHSRSTSGTLQPTTPITPSIIASPSFSRPPHDRLTSIPPDDLDPTPTPTPVTATTPTPRPTLIHIRDYGFAPTDPRFTGQGPHVPRANRPAFLARRLAPSLKSTFTSSSEGDDDGDSDHDDNNGYEDEEDDEEEGEEEEEESMAVDREPSMWEVVFEDTTNGWTGINWRFSSGWGFGGRTSRLGPSTSTGAGASEFPSRGDLDRNFGVEGPSYDGTVIDEEAEAFSDEDEGQVQGEGELLLVPGLYRALYAFEPEGTAEMKLDEDQLVRVIGRGGGVGWAVVVKGGLEDTGVHALVPESYLEPVRLDGEEDA